MLELKSQATLSLQDKGWLYPIVMEMKDRIRTARAARKITQAAVAEALKVTPQAVSGWERGEAEPEADKFPNLARVLRVELAWLHGEQGLGVIEQQPDTQVAEPIPKDALQVPGRPDFPVYASAEGGPGQIIRSTDPVDFQPRPAMLEKVVGAYGLIVTGDSMDPEYRSGDTALVNPHLPPIGGEVFIFYTERDGEARATIKHLRRGTTDKWLVSQHNPPDGAPKDFTLSRKEWGVAHRVVGKHSRR